VEGNILDTIGRTPLLCLNSIFEGVKPDVKIYAKLECYNPGGSVKDRAAFQMIKDAEESGELTKDKTIIDSTSGNTGIAYAMIAAVRGYKVKIVIPRNASIERKKIIAGFGAEIVYSSEFKGSDGSISIAKKIYDRDPEKYYMPDQYSNPSNWKALPDNRPRDHRTDKGRNNPLYSGSGYHRDHYRDGESAQGIQPRDKDHRC